MKAEQVAHARLKDPSLLDETIKKLKNEIEFECQLLFRRARTIYSASRGGRFIISFWEKRIYGIMRSKQDSYNIAKLKELKKQCIVVGREMEEFARELP